MINNGVLEVTEPGTYFAEIINEYGCGYITNAITVNIVDGSYPPDIQSVTICKGEDVNFHDLSDNNLIWYLPDSTIYHIGNTFNIDSVQTDLSLFAAYQITGCPPALQHVTIDVIEQINGISLGGDLILCGHQDSALLSALVPENVSFNWFNGDSLNTSVYVNQPGQYSITFRQCELEKTLNVNVLNRGFNAIAEFSDSIVCMGESAIFTPIFAEIQPSNLSVLWNTGDTVSNLMVTQQGSYFAIVTNSYGCTDTTSIFHINGVECGGILPNVITPNGDGINDFLVIEEATLFPNNELIILNRWGNVVYHKEGYLNQFNGDNVVDGVYFYCFKPFGKKNKFRERTGFVQILR